MNSSLDNYIRFMGTAGSRWVVAGQKRASGGVYLNLEGQRILMDPGPGALVRCAACDPPIDPTQLNGVVLTHGHIDHCSDVNIIIDAMTGGGFTRGGSFCAPGSCIDGEDADPLVAFNVLACPDGELFAVISPARLGENERTNWSNVRRAVLVDGGQRNVRGAGNGPLKELLDCVPMIGDFHD